MFMKMLQSSCIIILTVILYHRYLTYVNISEKGEKQKSLQFQEYQLQLRSIWKKQSDASENNKKVSFEIFNETNEIKILKQGIAKNITFKELGFNDIDAAHIQRIQEIDSGAGIFSITSQFFDIIYQSSTSNVCYKKINSNKNEEKIIFHENKLWIFTVPYNNVILLRVFQCSDQQGGNMVYSHKYLPPEKIHQIKNKIQIVNQEMVITFIGFSKSQHQYHFNSLTYELNSRNTIEASTIKSLIRHTSDFKVELSQSISQIELSKCIDQIVYQITFGYFGKKYTHEYSTEREVESVYQIQFLDTNNNLIMTLNAKDSPKVLSFGQKLIPLRTPIFMNEKQFKEMPPIDILLSNFDDYSQNMIDLKVYEIKNKNLLEMKNSLGIYKPLPDSSLNFISANKNMLNFYPSENLNPNSLIISRTKNGAVVFKGSKVQGFYDKVPVPDEKEDSIKYGRSSQEAYQHLTSNGIQVMPTIYEAHYIYKSLFASPKKNRVELINGLNGQSMISHYLSIKEGFALSSMFLENNQFFVFQHHQKSEMPPIITKYELFFNTSAHKTLLYIKRNYQVVSEGKITSVQKCIDTFYYFQSVYKGTYTITRIHQALMSNRQKRADHKYAGFFEKSMILESIQKNTKFLISELEELPLSLKLNIGEQQISQWSRLQFKHQYQILPYRVYYIPSNSTYIFFNIRKMLIESYDLQVPKMRVQITLKSIIIIGSLIVCLFLTLMFCHTQGFQQKVLKNQQKKNKNQPKSSSPKKVAAYKSIDFKKKDK